MPPRERCLQLRSIARLREMQQTRAEYEARESVLAMRRERDLLAQAETDVDTAIEGWAAVASGAQFDPAATLRWGAAAAAADAARGEQMAACSRADAKERHALDNWRISNCRAEQSADAHAVAVRMADRRRQERLLQATVITPLSPGEDKRPT